MVILPAADVNTGLLGEIEESVDALLITGECEAVEELHSLG